MPRVLVVDDTAVDRQLARGLLRDSRGLEVECAENGEDAINRMQESRPDLVVTDLQMPEMNGLELVTRIRMQFPEVPVILMTAQGSEEIAIEALEQGASSYVPKSQLGDKLKATVEEVLSHANADQTYAQLMRCQERIEFTYALDNEPQLIEALVELLQQIVRGMEFADHTGTYRLGVAVREALLNALFRGNLEFSFEEVQALREDMLTGNSGAAIDERRSESPYCDRKIRVDAKISRDEAHIKIRDDGPGFDVSAAMSARETDAIASLDAKQGRGMVLMHSFMDEITYNDAGNEVTLVKRR